jgi:hypothetical protein
MEVKVVRQYQLHKYLIPIIPHRHRCLPSQTYTTLNLHVGEVSLNMDITDQPNGSA